MKREDEEKREQRQEPRGISRREFARRAAVAAAGISAAPMGVFAQAIAPSSPAQQPSTERLSAAGQMEADAKTRYALATYGSRLNEAQKTDLGRLIKEGIEPLEELRKYSLKNGVQPATVLRLYPEPHALGASGEGPGKKGGK
ncbi:MAG: hypothetical protein ACLP1Y_09145 [Candidatus Acidiferrales bacterium]